MSGATTANVSARRVVAVANPEENRASPYLNLDQPDDEAIGWSKTLRSASALQGAR